MKRLLSVALIVSLLAMFPWVTPAVAEDAPQTVLPSDEVMPWENESDNVYNKIHVYLGDEDYATIDSAEELEESIGYVKSLGDSAQTYSANTRSAENDEKLQLTVQFASDFHKLPEVVELREERESLTTLDEVHEWRSRLNALSKEYHESIITNKYSIISDIESENYSHIDYSPYVNIELNTSEISLEVLTEIAFSSQIENICISNKGKYSEKMSMDSAFEGINASNVIGSGRFTGQDVNIGIYEALGIPSISHENFQNIRDQFHMDPAATTIRAHATHVLSIISATAPDADYFASHIRNDTLDFSWFLDNNCDVINCSFGGDMEGYDYGSDGYVDYISYNNFITIVVAAGNAEKDDNGNYINRRINSPGYALNAITVGGVDRDENGNIVHYQDSCYISDSDIIKPNISAFATIDIPNCNNVYGTSYATALVTGAIALLVDRTPAIANFPARILAMLTVTADKVTGHTNDFGFFDNETGAGVINLERAVNDITCSRFDSIDTENDAVIFDKYVELEAGQVLQVSLAWAPFVLDNGDNNYTPITTNYELALNDPEGRTILTSMLPNSNIEFIRYNVPISGTYNIIAFLNDEMSEYIVVDEVFLIYRII